MSVTAAFLNLVNLRGSPAIFHRESGGEPCPCRSVDGYRDPAWHEANPSAPVCSAEGMINFTITHLSVKAFVQPIQSTRATRLTSEYMAQMFGEVEIDDHLGIFPVYWSGNRLEFRDWSQRGNEFVHYHGRKFQVVNANLIPDPSDGNPEHHWEVALRLLDQD